MHIIKCLDLTLHNRKGCGLAGEILTQQRSVAKNRSHTVHMKAYRYWCEPTVDCALRVYAICTLALKHQWLSNLPASSFDIVTCNLLIDPPTSSKSTRPDKYSCQFHYASRHFSPPIRRESMEASVSFKRGISFYVQLHTWLQCMLLCYRPWQTKWCQLTALRRPGICNACHCASSVNVS